MPTKLPNGEIIPNADLPMNDRHFTFHGKANQPCFIDDMIKLSRKGNTFFIIREENETHLIASRLLNMETNLKEGKDYETVYQVEGTGDDEDEIDDTSLQFFLIKEMLPLHLINVKWTWPTYPENIHPNLLIWFDKDLGDIVLDSFDKDYKGGVPTTIEDYETTDIPNIYFYYIS